MKNRSTRILEIMSELSKVQGAMGYLASNTKDYAELRVRLSPRLRDLTEINKKISKIHKEVLREELFK